MGMVAKRFFVPGLLGFVLALIIFLPLFSQTTSTNKLVLRAGPGIKVDGQLAEPIWRRALRGESLLVPHPEREGAEGMSTQVFLHQDGQFLYVGFICQDSQPDQITATLNQRDYYLRNDDSIYVLFLGGKNLEYIYFFGLNLLNTQLDGRLNLVEGNKDVAWGPKWLSAVQKNAKGWTAEVAIPLEMFPSSGEEVRLNILVSRVIPRLDPVFWGGPLEPAFSLEQINLFQPLLLQQREKRLQGASFLLARQTPEDKTPLIGGLDLKYSFSTALTTRVLLFPEFGLVEPDEEWLNFTPYELKIPEKRDFFQDIFSLTDQEFNLFYTKRIRDIQAGIKVKGNFPWSEFVLLSTYAPEDKIRRIPTSSYHLAMVRLFPLPWLSIRLTGSSRLDQKNTWGNIGFDWRMDLSSGFTLRGQLAQSFGEKKEDNFALALFSSWQVKSTQFNLGFLRIGRNFGDNLVKIGYIPDDNRQEIRAQVLQTFKLKTELIDSFHLGAKGYIYWGLDNTLRSWAGEGLASLEFKSYWSIGLTFKKEYMLNEIYPEGFPGLEDKVDLDLWNEYRASMEDISLFDQDYVFSLFNPVVGTFYYLYMGKKEYWNYQAGFFSRFDKGEGGRFELEIKGGQFFVRDFTLFRLFKDLAISRTVFLEYSLYYLDFNFEIPPAYKSTNIHILKVDNRLSDRVNINIFFLANTALNKITFQLRTRYIFWAPRGVVESVVQRGSRYFRETNEDTAAFLCLSYQF